MVLGGKLPGRVDGRWNPVKRTSKSFEVLFLCANIESMKIQKAVSEIFTDRFLRSFMIMEKNRRHINCRIHMNF